MPEAKYIRAEAAAACGRRCACGRLCCAVRTAGAGKRESQREIRAYRNALRDAISYIQSEIIGLRFYEKKGAVAHLRRALRTRGGAKRGGTKNG